MQHNSSSMYSGNFYCSICCMLFTIFTCCLQHFLATTTAAATLLTVTTKGTSKCSRSNKNNNNDDGGSECKTPTSAAQSTARATDDYRCVSIRSCNNRHYQRHSRSRSCSRSPRRISISGATARSSHATRALSEITRWRWSCDRAQTIILLHAHTQTHIYNIYSNTYYKASERNEVVDATVAQRWRAAHALSSQMELDAGLE